MSAAFTAVTLTTDWAAQAFGTELALAVYERKRAAGISSAGASSVSAGDDAQAASFWADLQDVLDDLCTSYVDHTAGADPYAGWEAFTLSSWRLAAGLSSSGFRRATTWPTDWTNMADAAYSFGQAQAGDIIGPWIFKDLQLGLSALKWTLYAGSWSWADGEIRYCFGGEDSDCDAARNSEISAWNTASWASGGATWSAEVGVYAPSPTTKQFYAYRYRAKIALASIYTGLASAVEFWGLASYAVGAFADIDNLGLVDSQWFLMDTQAVDTEETRSSALLGDYGNPVETLPLACPFTGDVFYSYYVANVQSLLKWNFTNA
jgi:hypothetical protein